MFWRKIPPASGVLSRPDAALLSPPASSRTTEGASVDTKEKRSKKVKDSKKEDKQSFTVVGMRPIEIGGVADTYRPSSRHAAPGFDEVLALTSEAEGVNGQQVEDDVEVDPFSPILEPATAVRSTYSAGRSEDILGSAVSGEGRRIQEVVGGRRAEDSLPQQMVFRSNTEDRDPFEAYTGARETLPPRKRSPPFNVRPNLQLSAHSSSRLTPTIYKNISISDSESALSMTLAHPPLRSRRVSFQLEVDSDADFVTERFDSTYLQASLPPPTIHRSRSFESRNEAYKSNLDVESLIPPVLRRQNFSPPGSAPSSSRSPSPAPSYTRHSNSTSHIPLTQATGTEAYRSPSPMRATAPPPQLLPTAPTSNARQTQKYNGPRLTGIENLGNTCYLNATIQCLSATKPFAEYFLNGDYQSEINRRNRLGTQGEVATALAKLIQELHTNQAFVAPINFYKSITRYAAQFRGQDQQDAQEFLDSLLGIIHEDLNLIKKKPRPIELTPEREAELESLPESIAADQEWQIYRERNDSVVIDFFQGQFRSRLECLTCQQTSTTFTPFQTLSLEIPSPRSRDSREIIHLGDCIEAFLREEILDGDDAWICPYCRRPRRASKRLSLARLPQFLVIHLKRFSSLSEKIPTPVEFPLTSMDLGHLLPPNIPGVVLNQSLEAVTEYELYGVVSHHSDGKTRGGDSLTSGHYTAIVKHGDIWFEMDDEEGKIVSPEEVLSAQSSAYLLWYQLAGTNNQ